MIKVFQYHLLFLKYNKVVEVLSKVVAPLIDKATLTNERLKSNVLNFTILSCSAFNSAFVANFFISSFVTNVFNFFLKADSSTNLFAVTFAWSILSSNLL